MSFACLTVFVLLFCTRIDSGRLRDAAARGGRALQAPPARDLSLRTLIFVFGLMQLACAAGGKGRPRFTSTPGQGLVPSNPDFCIWTDAARLRGGRQGAPQPPAPPARGVAPGNPDSMHVYAER